MSGQIRYKDGPSFRRALEDRLNNEARSRNTVIQRLRYIVAFDRFLGRLSEFTSDGWMLKGGYAMELRRVGARTTKDIDLTVRAFKNEANILSHSSHLDRNLMDQLQNAASVDIGDFFTFTVGAAYGDIADALYGGRQFPITGFLGGREFQRFRVDVVIGDPPGISTEKLPGTDLLLFAGIKQESYPAIAAEQQFAEKLHVYSRPRTGAPNSRVKDLVDMLLLIRVDTMKKDQLSLALESTFKRRNTHSIPSVLPIPPDDWESQFHEYALECHLKENVAEAYVVVRDYLKACRG